MKPINVIHIFGASGAGTSTLGRAVSERFGYVHMDTDDYYWFPTDPPFQQSRPVPERLTRMRADMNGKRCVVSGSLCGWGDSLRADFGLVIWLQTPTPIRLKRIREREYQRFGDRIRAGGDMYEQHQRFLEWAAGYDTGNTSTRSWELHRQWLEQIHCVKLVLSGVMPREWLLKQVGGHLADGL